MIEINGDYSKNKAAWNADSPKVKAVATNVCGRCGAGAVVAALDGAIYPDGELNMSAAWMGGGSVQPPQSNPPLTSSRVLAVSAQVADSYTKFVNSELAK